MEDTLWQMNLTVTDVWHNLTEKGVEKRADLSYFGKQCFDWYYKAQDKKNCT